MLLDIVQVARRSNLPTSTLRHYEEKGLIGSVGRRGLRRLFEARVMEQLALIRLGRSAAARAGRYRRQGFRSRRRI